MHFILYFLKTFGFILGGLGVNSSATTCAEVLGLLVLWSPSPGAPASAMYPGVLPPPSWSVAETHALKGSLRLL